MVAFLRSDRITINTIVLLSASDKASDVHDITKKFKHVNPIVLNVGTETERLEELVEGHDLVIR